MFSFGSPRNGSADIRIIGTMADHDITVSQLERTLEFFPVRNDAPRRLRQDEIRRFNMEGWLGGYRIFDAEQAMENRRKFDRILEGFFARGMNSYSIDRYHDRIRTIHDLATTPAILDIVEDLVGPDIVCWATHFFCKMPGDEQVVSWHQDASYWALTPSRTITVWLAIDDADGENGCMQVFPGSHLHGHITWRETAEQEGNVLTQTIDGVERFGSPRDVPLRAGEISIHSDLLVHGSRPNRSNRRRCGLTLRYCPPAVRAYWGWNEKSILCRGNDPSGHWANLPPPPGDDCAPQG